MSASERRFDGLVRTLNATVVAATAGVGVKAKPHISPPRLPDRLALPRRIHEPTGRLERRALKVIAQRDGVEIRG